MPRLDSTDAVAALDLHCLKWHKGPFSCIADHLIVHTYHNYSKFLDIYLDPDEAPLST